MTIFFRRFVSKSLFLLAGDGLLTPIAISPSRAGPLGIVVFSSPYITVGLGPFVVYSSFLYVFRFSTLGAVSDYDVQFRICFFFFDFFTMSPDAAVRLLSAMKRVMSMPHGQIGTGGSGGGRPPPNPPGRHAQEEFS
ncbi:hypothetical protein HDV63DRAFT_390266 [Trichoderma sp. SZMC 28014]